MTDLRYPLISHLLMSGVGKKIVDEAKKVATSKGIDWDGMSKLLVSDEARYEFVNLRRAFDEVNHELQTKFSQKTAWLGIFFMCIPAGVAFGYILGGLLEMIGHYLAEFSIFYKLVKHGRPGVGATHSSRFIPLK